MIERGTVKDALMDFTEYMVRIYKLNVNDLPDAEWDDIKSFILREATTLNEYWWDNFRSNREPGEEFDGSSYYEEMISMFEDDIRRIIERRNNGPKS